jgi:hypothetical protein
MRKPIFFSVTAVGLIGTSAPSAQADICFEYTVSGGGIGIALALQLL